MDRPSGVVNVDAVEATEESRGERFAWRRLALGSAAGSRRLGCSLYELPPGRRSWPYHYHHGNEEAIFVLEGTGTLRLAGREVPVARGDYVSLPVGAEGAHQMINSSESPLRYLCLSTMEEPDVTVYPDSDKIGIMAGSAPGGAKDQRTLHAFLKADARVGYWDGEE